MKRYENTSIKVEIITSFCQKDMGMFPIILQKIKCGSKKKKKKVRFQPKHNDMQVRGYTKVVRGDLSL